MPEPLIRVTGLYKIFGPDPKSILPLLREGRGKHEILAETGHSVGLNDISLEIEKGRIFVVMGLSGSGKSTLIRHFNRLIEPTEGAIHVDGTDVMRLSTRQLEAFRRRRMSMVFQRFALMPHRTVLANAAYGLRVQGTGKRAAEAKAREWLQAVGLEGYEAQFPAQLSGGQQQRVGLARALCTDADILLMDEPFSALDPLIRSEMQDRLVALQKKLRKTVIFITHDLDEALRLGDRIAILKDGALVQIGAPEEIILHPADAYVEAFVRNVDRARALTVAAAMTPPAQLIAAKTVAEALQQMQGESSDYGYCVSEQGYRGVVSRKALEAAAAIDPDGPLGETVLEPVAAISPKSLLRDVLPVALKAAFPLPVVDEDGALCGQLSRETLADVLAERTDTKKSGTAKDG